MMATMAVSVPSKFLDTPIQIVASHAVSSTDYIAPITIPAIA